MSPRDIIPLALPLLAIQVGLMVYSLVDLARRDRRVRWFPKPVWAAVIVLGELVGPAVYLAAGREEA